MSFINFNNRTALEASTYSARMIAEALYQVETKNINKIKSLVESIKEPLATAEALKMFENKLVALNALQTAAANAMPVNEGQFSWMTQDTGEQIGSERENRITVYMYDNDGNQYKENKYEGYGEFGGMDYYELLARMNGYTEEDLEEVKGPFKELRQLGIDVTFDKLKTKDKGRKVLYPALVTDPRYNWKKHDFTQEPENDPNQSWYVEPEYDEYDEDEYYESKTNEAKKEIKYYKTVSKKDWDGASKDYKSVIDGEHYMMFLDNKLGSILAPVKVEEGELYGILESKVNEAAKIACIECDEVNTGAAWKKNNGVCPSCNSSTQGVAESVVNEARSINKIQKEYGQVVKDMIITVKEWKNAEGDRKVELLKKLKVLTARKKDLIAELDAAVGLKDADVELVGEATMQEIDKKVQKFIIKNAKDYDYSNQDSAFQIYSSIKKLYPNLIKESVNEADFGKPNNGDYSDEMSYSQLESCIDNASMIRDRIKQGVSLDAWMHSQIAVAKNELTSVFDALDGDDGVVEKFELTEGVMSNLHQMAGDVKDEEEFVKKFFKEYGAKVKKNAESTEWVKSLYNDTVEEAVITEAKKLDRDEMMDLLAS